MTGCGMAVHGIHVQVLALASMPGLVMMPGKMSKKTSRKRDKGATMAAKRKTLPKNFIELLDAGDNAQIMELYSKCALNARYDSSKSCSTALHAYALNEELARWLCDQGLDINTPDYYGRTPLHIHAGAGTAMVSVLIELGADVNRADNYGTTPLHRALGNGKAEAVRLLVEHGADLNALNDRGQSPLQAAMLSCSNVGIIPLAASAKLLTSKGVPVTTEMKESIERLAQSFEFYRDSFNKDMLPKTDEALDELCALTGAVRPPRMQKHNGRDTITVAQGSWQKQYEDLWNYLVPGHGSAATAQGEVIRITGKIRDELMRNGGANWSRQWRMMLNTLPELMSSANSLSKQQLERLKAASSAIHAQGDDDDETLEELCQLAVQWVALNPNPIPLDPQPYKL